MKSPHPRAGREFFTWARFKRNPVPLDCFTRNPRSPALDVAPRATIVGGGGTFVRAGGADRAARARLRSLANHRGPRSLEWNPVPIKSLAA
ncbi:unnamed protein product, partial [marine sediment metagenome]